MRATTVLATICFVGIAAGARAQSGDRVRITFNAAEQVTSRTLTQDFSIPINLEPAPMASSIELASAPLFDVGGSYRIVNRLAVGASVSLLSRNVDASVDAEIPHPFYFDKLRPISGNLSDLTHRETGVHIYAMYSLPLNGKLGIAVFGGPSRFSVKQDFVSNVDYTATYPFDTATFSRAQTETVSTSAVGFNVGTDVSWRLSRSLAVGGLIRFTGASKTISVASGNEVDAEFGGLQTGAGIRLSF